MRAALRAVLTLAQATTRRTGRSLRAFQHCIRSVRLLAAQVAGAKQVCIFLRDQRRQPVPSDRCLRSAPRLERRRAAARPETSRFGAGSWPARLARTRPSAPPLRCQEQKRAARGAAAERAHASQASQRRPLLRPGSAPGGTRVCRRRTYVFKKPYAFVVFGTVRKTTATGGGRRARRR